MNNTYTNEELIVILRAMKTICGLSRTEKEALEQVINKLDNEQED